MYTKIRQLRNVTTFHIHTLIDSLFTTQAPVTFYVRYMDSSGMLRHSMYRTLIDSLITSCVFVTIQAQHRRLRNVDNIPCTELWLTACYNMGASNISCTQHGQLMNVTTFHVPPFDWQLATWVLVTFHVHNISGTTFHGHTLWLAICKLHTARAYISLWPSGQCKTL